MLPWRELDHEAIGLFAGFTWKGDDGTSIPVNGGEFNLRTNIDISTFTWVML